MKSVFRPGILFILPLALAILMIVQFPAQVQAQPAAAAGQIAFVSMRDGNPELYVMQADGSGLLRLTNAPLQDGDAAWSPDGTRLAFVTEVTRGQTELAIVEAASAQVTVLTGLGAPVSHPVWSPDGSWIAFAANLSGNHDIFVIHPDGSNLANVTRSASNDIWPSWSQDGMQIAFQSDRDGHPEIYAVTVASGAVSRLTNSPDASYSHNPIWSPDGARIAYLLGHNGSNDLFVINADGSTPVQLSTTAQNSAPAWSPDGSSLAFISQVALGQAEVFVVWADGAGLRQITTAGATMQQPTWSPDGTWIACASDSGGAFDLVALDMATNSSYNLTNRADVDDIAPLWAPAAQTAAVQPGLPLPPTATANQPGLPPPPTATTGQPALPAPPTSTQGALPTLHPPTAQIIVVPTPTQELPTPTNTPITNPDLLLVYNTMVPSFDLINVSGHTLNLASIMFEGGMTRVDSGVWNRPETSSPIDDFAAGGCLGLWALGSPKQPTPSECRMRHGWWESDTVVFWTSGSFTVYYMGRPIAVCETAAGRCPVLLSGSVNPAAQPQPQPAAPTVNPVANPNAELLLIYNTIPAFDLVNVSGRALNVAPLSFQGNGLNVGTNIWLKSGGMSGELDNFPVGGCLALWGLNINQQPIPSECRHRHSWWGSDDVLFWTGGTFTVSYNGVAIATCDTASGRCAVDLP